jgi:virulence-associated protein VapD
MMFAIAFDLVVRETAAHHPKSVGQAYAAIRSTLAGFGFERIQGSVYVTRSEDLANLFRAITALKTLPWFPHCCGSTRARRGCYAASATSP